MHDISSSFNRLLIHVLISNDIDKDAMKFEDTCGGCKRLFSSPIPVFYTRHTDHLLTIWQLLILFGLYNAFLGSWNHVSMIPLVKVISIFLFGIEPLSVQLEEPFSIFPMQGFNNNIYDNYYKIIGWVTNEEKNNVERVTEVTADVSDLGTGGGRISEGWVNMVQGMYLNIPSRL